MLEIEFSARLNLIYSPPTQAIVIEICLHRLCQVLNPSSPLDYPHPSELVFFLLRYIFFAYHLYNPSIYKKFIKNVIANYKVYLKAKL